MLTDTGAMAGQTLYLRITLVAPLPGVLYSLQGAKGAPVGHVMSTGADLSLDLSVDFVEDARGVRYLGPFARNQGGRRFVYFAVGSYAGQPGPAWSRRGKVWFEDLPVDLAREAAATGRRIEARFPGVARDGGPSCATVRPIDGWRMLPA